MSARNITTLLLTLALLSPAALAAKGKGARETTPLESLQYVVKQLDLTPDQQPKADQILADLEQKLTDLKHQARAAAHPTGKRATKLSPTTQPTVTGSAKDALLSAVGDIDKLLTPEQSTRFHKLLAEERAARKEQQQERRDRRRHDAAATRPAA
jgi:Spy/CpxP family protein refolding chaperone